MVFRQVEWILYGDAGEGRGPVLLNLGEDVGLSDGDHHLLIIPPGEEVQKPNPKLANIRPVVAPPRPGCEKWTGLATEPGVPAINLKCYQNTLSSSLAIVLYLLPSSLASPLPRTSPATLAALGAQHSDNIALL